MHLRDLLEELIGQENAKKFAEWAFGKEYLNLDGLENFAKSWNELHGNIFKIEMSNPVCYDVPEMIQIWRNHEKF